MAKFLVFHAVPSPMTNPKAYTTDAQMAMTKPMLDGFTADTYCITTWSAAGTGKMTCLWEAPSEQAIIDVLAKTPDIIRNMPIDSISTATVIDWAEMKKALAGG